MILDATKKTTALKRLARHFGADVQVGWDADDGEYVMVWGARTKGCPMPEGLGADYPQARENLRMAVARGPRDWNDQE
jgi:hypothetical protein